jgi:hypothetical protein
MIRSLLRGAAWFAIAELIPSLALFIPNAMSCGVGTAWGSLVLIWLFGSPLFAALGVLAFVLGFLAKGASPKVARGVTAGFFLLLLVCCGAAIFQAHRQPQPVRSCLLDF